MTTTTLKKLAEVTQYYFHAYGMTRKGEHGDDGDHVYWVRYSDVEALQQEVETLRTLDPALMSEAHRKAKRDADLALELKLPPELSHHIYNLLAQVQAQRNNLAHARQEALEQLSSKLKDRAQWLRKEYLNGGSYEHLAAREQECTYIGTDMIRALQQHTGEVPGSTLVEALDKALELLSVPEHAQDEEWQRKYYEVVEVHNRYVPKAALEDGETKP